MSQARHESDRKVRKYKVNSEAVCSECCPAREYSQMIGDKLTVDAWAKKHVREHPGHIVTIHETHDVSSC